VSSTGFHDTQNTKEVIIKIPNADLFHSAVKLLFGSLKGLVRYVTLKALF